MTVSDIHSRNSCHDLGDFRYCFGIANHPKGVTKAVQVGYEVVFRFACDHLSNDAIQVLAMRISKEDRFHVGIIYTDMLHTIFLFVATGKFVLHDTTFHIVLYPCSENESILGTSVHCLRIDIITVLLILQKPTFLAEEIELLTCYCIHACVVLVRTYFKVDLWLDDMIQGHRITCRLLACFVGIEYVVWTTADLLS